MLWPCRRWWSRTSRPNRVTRRGGSDRTALPYPLRGDRAHLVDFDLREAQFDTKKALDEWIGDFIRPHIADAHVAEERRLAYVAFTRAKRHLWLGAELMGSRTEPDELSPFLTEAVEALGLTVDIPEPADESGEDRIETTEWPVPRTRQVAAAQQAASWVEASPEVSLETLADVHGDVGRYAAQALRVGARPGAAATAGMPDRLSATALVSWRRDPQGFRTQVLRPIPTPPSRAAEIGTNFHSWVEQHFGQSSIDIGEDEAVRPIDAATIKRLQSTFLASEFATRRADHVEMSFELVLGRFRVPGKIDAVFITDGHAEVVDWKTSKKPDTQVLEVIEVAAGAVPIRDSACTSGDHRGYGHVLLRRQRRGRPLHGTARRGRRHPVARRQRPRLNASVPPIARVAPRAGSIRFRGGSEAWGQNP